MQRDDGGGYNQHFKRLMYDTRGQRKGQLWRSERDWIATDTKPKGEIVHSLQRQLDKSKEQIKGFYDKGWSKERKTRCKGYIPIEFMLAQPELWHDDDAVDAFLKEFPKFSTNYYNVDESRK